MNIYERIINILIKSRLNEVVDIEGEEEEFLRMSGGDIIKARKEMQAASKGREVNLKPETMSKVSNTDAVSDPNKSKFSRLKQWAKTMQGNSRGKDSRRRVYNQVKTNTDDPSIIRSDKGNRELVAGNTRASLRAALGQRIKAHVYNPNRR